MLLAVEDSLDGVVDTAEVGRLDLSHVAGFLLREVYDVLQRVAPFVGYDFGVDAFAVDHGADVAQSLDLCLALAHIHGAFDAQLERRCDGSHLTDVVSDGHGVVVEDDAQRAVDVDVDRRVVALEGFQLLDAVAQPLHVFLDLLALEAHLRLDVVEEGVRQYVGGLHDHLVGVHVAVVARLGEDGDDGVGDLRAVLVGDDFGHQHAAALGHSVEAGLGHAVADGGVIFLARLGVYILVGAVGHLAEGGDLLAHVERGDLPLDDGDEILGQEERVASARAGVLHRGAVAVSHRTVFEYEDD